MSQVDTKIGPKIKAFRRQLGIQANKLAEEMSISPSYLNLIESGKRKIDGDLLLRVCDKLKIELSDLTSKTDIKQYILFYYFVLLFQKFYLQILLILEKNFYFLVKNLKLLHQETHFFSHQ